MVDEPLSLKVTPSVAPLPGQLAPAFLYRHTERHMVPEYAQRAENAHRTAVSATDYLPPGSYSIAWEVECYGEKPDARVNLVIGARPYGMLDHGDVWGGFQSKPIIGGQPVVHEGGSTSGTAVFHQVAWPFQPRITFAMDSHSWLDVAASMLVTPLAVTRLAALGGAADGDRFTSG